MACLDDPETETRLVSTCEKHAVTAGFRADCDRVRVIFCSGGLGSFFFYIYI